MTSNDILPYAYISSAQLSSGKFPSVTEENKDRGPLWRVQRVIVQGVEMPPSNPSSQGLENSVRTLQNEYKSKIGGRELRKQGLLKRAGLMHRKLKRD